MQNNFMQYRSEYQFVCFFLKLVPTNDTQADLYVTRDNKILQVVR